MEFRTKHGFAFKKLMSYINTVNSSLLVQNRKETVVFTTNISNHQFSLELNKSSFFDFFHWSWSEEKEKGEEEMQQTTGESLQHHSYECFSLQSFDCMTCLQIVHVKDALRFKVEKSGAMTSQTYNPSIGNPSHFLNTYRLHAKKFQVSNILHHRVVHADYTEDDHEFHLARSDNSDLFDRTICSANINKKVVEDVFEDGLQELYDTITFSLDIDGNKVEMAASNDFSSYSKTFDIFRSFDFLSKLEMTKLSIDIPYDILSKFYEAIFVDNDLHVQEVLQVSFLSDKMSYFSISTVVLQSNIFNDSIVTLQVWKEDEEE